MALSAAPKLLHAKKFFEFYHKNALRCSQTGLIKPVWLNSHIERLPVAARREKIVLGRSVPAMVENKQVAPANSKESAEKSSAGANFQGFLNTGMSIPLVAIIVGFISVCVAWAR